MSALAPSALHRIVRSRPVVECRALGGDAPQGTFEAIVACYSTDSYGDRIMPGAFEETLKPPPDGRGFPAVVWSHRWDEPPIGATMEAGEVEQGLRIVAQLFIEQNARAREVYAAMATPGGDGLPPLREFSFAFFIKRMEWMDEVDETGADRLLHELDCIEVGPTLLGANPDTELIDVASRGGASRRRDDPSRTLARALDAVAGMKQGAVLSAANRAHVEDAIEHLNEVLAAADGAQEDAAAPPAGKSETDETRTAALAAMDLDLLPAHVHATIA